MNTVNLTLLAIAALAVLIVTDRIVTIGARIDVPVVLSINELGNAEFQYGSPSSPTRVADYLR
jgi:hypothetical protein